jgi:hypothetical protein
MAVSLAVSNDRPRDRAEEMWLKRQAIQIAGQLPEDQEKAVKVLEYARALLTDFIAKD